mmetsp:Transcript_29282/g.46021  ORF Transcript_29282/g.46021 Transcript_29282/m.46021 type:complete len:84 (-) Transcript_29282:347-598(-)
MRYCRIVLECHSLLIFQQSVRLPMTITQPPKESTPTDLLTPPLSQNSAVSNSPPRYLPASPFFAPLVVSMPASSINSLIDFSS